MARPETSEAPLRVACLQLNAGEKMAENLAAVRDLALRAADRDARLLTTPEYVAVISGSGRAMRETAFPEASHPALAAFRELAVETSAWVLIGSLTIAGAPSGEDDRIANRSYLLDDRGAIVARYDKIFMFDATLPSGRTIRESGTYRPGSRACVAATPWGGLGLTICYDLRFPQLYRALARAGAKHLAIPSSFTRVTGAAHWHVLVRARAIETGSYVFAPAMCGEHPGNRDSYGHSLIVDPWGTVLAEGDDEPGIIVADVDPARVDDVRARLPSLEHDRDFEIESASPPLR